VPPPSTSDRSGPGRLRVTVLSGTRRADLALPAVVPLVELLPALARSLGLLDAATVPGGYRVVTTDGRELSGDASLADQDVEDGDLLVVAGGADEAPSRVYDDVAEAMAEVVQRDLDPWDAASGRRIARTAAALLLVLGVAGLLTQRGSLRAGVAAAVGAVVLLSLAAVLARPRHEPRAAVPVAWLAVAYAAVAGVLVTDRAASGLSAVAAGGGVLVAGLVGLVGLEVGRALMVPPVAAGTILVTTGLVVRVTGFDPAAVLTTVLVLGAMAGSVFPWLALDASGARVAPLHSSADITADPAAIDPARIVAGVRLGHDILVALSASVGLLLVLTAPLAVSLGRAGTLLAVLAALVLMLRTRQYRSGAEVLVGLASGVAGLVSVGASLLWLHPAWRPPAALALPAIGGVLLAATLLPATASVRRDRLGDVAESASLLLLPLLLVIAVGLLAAVRG
jgi:type VII secretion integral membrane protein EccD